MKNKYGIRINLDYDLDTYHVGEGVFKAMLCTTVAKIKSCKVSLYLWPQLYKKHNKSCAY